MPAFAPWGLLVAALLAPRAVPAPGPFQAWAVRPDGDRVAWARDGNWFDLIDAGTGKKLWSGRGADGDQITALAFAPDGRTVAAGAKFTSVVRVWDAATGEAGIAAGASAAGVRDLAYGPDGRLIAAAGEDGAVHLLDARSGALRGSFAPAVAERPVAALAWAGAEEMVSACDAGGGYVWELTERPRERSTHRWEGREARRLAPCAGRPAVLAVDGRGRVALWGTDRAVRLVELASGQTRWERTFPATAAAFTPTGDGVVVTGPAGTRLWERGTGREVPLPPALTGPAAGVRFAAGRVWLAGEVGGVRVAAWPYRLPEPILGSVRPPDQAIAGADAGAAGRAIERLRRDPATVALARDHLRPAAYPPAPVAVMVADQIRNLQSDDYEARERAGRALRALGPEAAPELDRHAGILRDPDALVRLELARRRHDPWGGPAGAVARRWLELLERIDTPEAWAVVRRAADAGDPEHPTTRAATRSLTTRPGPR